MTEIYFTAWCNFNNNTIVVEYFIDRNYKAQRSYVKKELRAEPKDNLIKAYKRALFEALLEVEDSKVLCYTDMEPMKLELGIDIRHMEYDKLKETIKLKQERY